MGFSLSPLALCGVSLVLVAATSVYSGLRTRRRYAALGAGPPQVVASASLGLNLIIGMVKALGSHKFHLWVQRLLEQHNHTMELHLLGEKLIMTDDPENIKAIQDTQFWDFKKSEEQHEIFKHIFGDNIFSMNGDEWKAETTLYKTHLSRVHESDLQVIEKHIVRAFALLDKAGHDASDVVDRFQLDVVTEVYCGESTNSLTSNQQPFRSAMEKLQKIACIRQLLGKVGVLLDDKYLVPRAVKFVDDFENAMVDRAFSRADKTTLSSTSLVDDLIRKGKTRNDVKNAIITTLLGAKDPAATSLAFAIYEIARRPDVFVKMKAEVEQNIGLDRRPVLADLHKLKYVKMVVKETLRAHHPLGYNPRVPVRDTTLPRGGGPDGRSPVAVLKGTQIIWGLITLQHRNDLGVADASEWRPERWETWKPKDKWEFVPFNHGPRPCIGQQFALVEMEYFLARLCQEYETLSLMSHSEPQEGLMKLELNTKLAYPVYTECKRRKARV